MRVDTIIYRDVTLPVITVAGTPNRGVNGNAEAVNMLSTALSFRHVYENSLELHSLLRMRSLVQILHRRASKRAKRDPASRSGTNCVEFYDNSRRKCSETR